MTPLCSARPSLSHLSTPNPQHFHIHPCAATAWAPWDKEQPLVESSVDSKLGSPQKAPTGAGRSSYPLLVAAGLTFIFRCELYKLAFLSGLSSRNCVKLNGNELH